jgi:hypothetical protein
LAGAKGVDIGASESFRHSALPARTDRHLKPAQPATHQRPSRTQERANPANWQIAFGGQEAAAEMNLRNSRPSDVDHIGHSE